MADVPPQSGQEYRLGYRRWLDGLRGVAIGMVLLFHLDILPGGFLGVDLFFVLSGFLITALLLQEYDSSGRINLWRFYQRRVLRLVPAFVLLLLVTFCLVVLTGRSTTANYLRETLVAGLYLADYAIRLGVAMPNLGHTWSLAIEEQFYLLWPVLLLLLLRFGFRSRSLCLLLALAILAVALHRAWSFAQLPGDGPEKFSGMMRLYMGLDTRADALLAGCVVGVLASRNCLPTSLLLRVVLWVVALLAAVYFAQIVWTTGMGRTRLYRGMFTVVAVMSGVMLCAMLARAPRGVLWVLERPALVWLGRLSYSLYLFHLPVFSCVDYFAHSWAAPLRVCLQLILSLAASLFSFFVVERPFLLLKRRLASSDLPPEQSVRKRPATHAA